jgi:nicotinamidase/pyrazinamidase
MKALLAIDYQNDFFNKELFFDKDKNMNFIERSVKKIKEFKEKNGIIITTQDWHRKNDVEFHQWPEHCIKNTYGSELIPEVKEVLENYSNHIEIKKKRYSAFYGSDLDEIIKKNEISTFYVIGLVSNVCVLFTVEDIINRGMKAIVYEDLVLGSDEFLHKYSLIQMEKVLGAELTHA